MPFLHDRLRSPKYVWNHHSVNDGCVQNVYTGNKDLRVDVLELDMMDCCSAEQELEDYKYYKARVEKEIEYMTVIY